MGSSARGGRRGRATAGLGIAGALVALALSATVVVHDGAVRTRAIDGCDGWQCGTNHNQVLL